MDPRVRVGRRIKSKVDFSGVPKETEGVIDEIYNNQQGFMVAWDLPNRPIPPGYSRHDGKPVVVTGLLRNGFGLDEVEPLEFL